MDGSDIIVSGPNKIAQMWSRILRGSCITSTEVLVVRLLLSAIAPGIDCVIASMILKYPLMLEYVKKQSKSLHIMVESWRVEVLRLVIFFSRRAW
jgi:hypothetical protein